MRVGIMKLGYYIIMEQIIKEKLKILLIWLKNILQFEKADYTEFPIVAVELKKEGKDSIGVLDGNHRVFQAREDGKTELKGYLIPLKDIEKYIIKK